jgi:hypothetical protein
LGLTCKKGQSNNNESYLRATIDNIDITFDTPPLAKLPLNDPIKCQVISTRKKLNDTLFFSFTILSNQAQGLVSGVYPNGPFTVVVSYQSPSGLYTFRPQQNNFQITFEEVTSNRIKGTFQGELTKTDNTTILQIRNGVFDLEIYP